ncbi:MAG: hypothetical protein JRD89_05045 [Deltaproteobacteria bacterium]|nr:hypothetical protein [Deltaproteobacteria bacterium]
MRRENRKLWRKLFETAMFIIAASYFIHLFSVAAAEGLPADVEYRFDCLCWQIISFSALIMLYLLRGGR